MRIYIKSVDTAFPPKKLSVDEHPTLDPQKKELLKKMGYLEYFYGDSKNDCLDIVESSAKNAIRSAHLTAKDIQLFMLNAGGNARAMGEYPVAAYMQSQIGLTTCPGIALSTMCTTVSSSLTLFRAMASVDKKYVNTLVSVGNAVFKPFYDPIGADLEKQRGVVYASGAASFIASIEEGPVEILEASLGATYVEGESWDIPINLCRFEYDDESNITSGGIGIIKWKSAVADKNKTAGYQSPAQIVLKDVFKELGQAIVKHSISEIHLSCIPISTLSIKDMLKDTIGKMTNIIENNSIYKRYGHIGSGDPLIVMHDAIKNKKPGYYAHLCVGQGYTGSLLLFKVI